VSTARSLPLDLPIGISLSRQIACVEREISRRRRELPDQIGQAFAEEAVAEMEAVLRTLKAAP